MNRASLTLGALLLAAGLSGAEPSQSFDQTPLPPGPVIKRLPDFAEWQIAFSYFLPPQAGGAAAQPAKAGGRPVSLTITHTKPRWHTVLVDGGGAKREMWSDGSTVFDVSGGSRVIALSDASPRLHEAWIEYSPGHDFPGTEWVSPDNYLGMQRGTSLWVFQQGANGAKVWVDSNTHYPVRYQSATEARTYQVLDSPDSLLEFPANVAASERGVKWLRNMSRVSPPSPPAAP